MTTHSYTHSEETRAKLSARAMGRKRSQDSIEKQRAAITGVKRRPRGVPPHKIDAYRALMRNGNCLRSEALQTLGLSS